MTDEIANLSRFLDEQREVLRHKAGGLDPDGLRRTLPPSDLTLGGMVKHLAFVEDWWFRRTLLDDQDAFWAAVDWDADHDWEWHSAADDGPDELWARYDAAVARSREAVATDPRGSGSRSTRAGAASRSRCAGSWPTWCRSTRATTATPT